MRPSARIGVVEVQKLEVCFCVFVGRARLSAGIGVVEVQKLGVFLRFCRCARDPLRGSAWSRCKNSSFFAFLTFPDEPSAGIGVVEVQKFEVFCVLTFPDEPSAEIVRVEALSLWRGAKFFLVSANLAREMAFGSCLVVCAPAFAIPRSRARFPPGPRQLRLENRSF